MKINPGKSKAVSFTLARVKERIRYYFGDQLIPEASKGKRKGHPATDQGGPRGSE